MTLVIDASVAIKWVLPEGGAERAMALHEQPEELIAPTLIAAEIGSVMRRRAAIEELTAREARDAAEIAIGLINRMVPIPALAERALELAMALRHPIYDCFYLALAERERAPLISADKKLIRIAKRAKGIEVRAL
ncbi:MAG: type II toxin-antitoxin system VapC family toxin [Xanthobacteraceae bacterium]|nr:type II toxin-antitoxin system VapC family toxin [Xanthobacteraceae bacterium]